MSAFDVFDPGAGIRAGNQKYNAIKKGNEQAANTISNFGNEAIQQFQESGNQSEDFINQGYDTAGNAINNAYNTGTGNINAGYDQGNTFLNEGHGYLDANANNAIDPLNQAGDNWQTLLDKGNAGIDAYGMYNPDKGQAGLDAFHNSTDYLNSRAGADAGTQALLRAGAGQGQVGRMQGDLAKYLMQYDQGILKDVRAAYDPYFGMAQNAASGFAGVAGQKADLYGQLGRDHATISGKQAGLATDRANQLSGLAQWQGSGLSDLATGRAGSLTDNSHWTATGVANTNLGMGNALSGLQQQTGQAKGQKFADNYAAQQTADNNQWNAIMGLGQAVGFV